MEYNYRQDEFISKLIYRIFLIAVLFINVTALMADDESPSFRHLSNNKLENSTNGISSDDWEDVLTQTGEDIKSLTLLLIKSAKTEKEKAKAIYDWIAGNIAYDTASYFSGNISYVGDISEITFQTKKSVCQGYAELFKRMCDFAGLKSVVISGYSKGYGYNLGDKIEGKSNHAWNAVQIDNKWQLLDSTWGAGYVNENKNFVKKFNEYYFLTSPEQFIIEHFPDNEEWQLLENKISKDEFSSLPKLNNDFFNLGIKLLNNNTSVIKNESEFLTIDLESPEDVIFIADLYDFKSGKEFKNHAIAQRKNKIVEVKTTFPMPGEFLLKIFAKKKNKSGMYEQVLEYKVISSSSIYNGQLVETFLPFSEKDIQIIGDDGMSMNLGLGNKYSFTYYVPGAIEVVFIDNSNKWIQLMRSSDVIWDEPNKQNENDKDTFFLSITPKQKGMLKLFAKYSKDKDYTQILEYKVN